MGMAGFSKPGLNFSKYTVLVAVYKTQAVSSLAAGQRDVCGLWRDARASWSPGLKGPVTEMQE